MTFPFINWFWRREKTGVNWNWKISDHIGSFDRAQKEYDTRMIDFEKHLNDAGLYEEYMALRNCAARVSTEWNRIQFTREVLDFNRPKD